MNRTVCSPTMCKCVLVAMFLLLAGGPALLLAGEGIFGEWQYKSTRQGRERITKISFSQSADGKIAGNWASQRGESKLSDIKFEGNKLTFVRTFQRQGGNEFKITFACKLVGDKLIGTRTTPRGEREVTLTRVKPIPSILGQWNLIINFNDNEFPIKLTISKEASGDLAGKWDSSWGQSVISNVKYQNGKLTFDRKTTFPQGDRSFESSFEGTVEGHTLTAVIKSERGEIEANGMRLGGGLIGKWEFTRPGRDGNPRISTLIIKDDLTATYQFRRRNSDREPIKVDDLKIDGDQVTFKMVLRFNDNEFPMEFKGKLDGETLKGEFITSRGAREATGKKVSTETPEPIRL